MTLMPKITSVAKQWEELLSRGGYEPPQLTRLRFVWIKRYSRTWKKLHRLLKISPGATLFEFGCGGGQHLVPLALHGHPVIGIDVSSDVLGRCRSFISEVEKFAGRQLPIRLHLGDFLEYSDSAQYDVVFNFGVIEHFVNEAERFSALRKMLFIAKPGGYVVSVVPNGIHPLRARQRVENLGGYHVPEIDYDRELAIDELRRIGAVEPQVHPTNLFWHLTIDSKVNRLAYLIRKACYYGAQLVPIIPSGLAYRHAGSLIIIGRKPS